jgi:hypothetical protein
MRDERNVIWNSLCTEHFEWRMRLMSALPGVTKVDSCSSAFSERDPNAPALDEAAPSFERPTAGLAEMPSDRPSPDFSRGHLSTTADAVPVAEQIQTMAGLGRAAFTVSANGFLVYRTARLGQIAQLAWFDRSGRQTGKLGQPENSAGIRRSPDRKSSSINTLDAATGTAIFGFTTSHGG